MGILANAASFIATLRPAEDRERGQQAVDVRVAALQVALARAAIGWRTV